MGVPTGYYWGVDSVTPIHQPAGGKKTLMDYVKEQAGATPRFWGRYLVGPSSFQLTQVEVDWVAKNSPSTRLLLVFDRPQNVHTDRATGESDARAAISAANLLKIPDNVIIYADLEPNIGKSVSADWIAGWWSVMSSSRFGWGGLYGNTASTFWRAYLDSAYDAALKQSPMPGGDHPIWAMYPLQLHPQRGKNHRGYRPDEINFFYDPGSLPSMVHDPFVWQYDIDCFIPTGGTLGAFDMDLANQNGFDGMWYVGPRPSLSDADLQGMIPKNDF